MLDMNLLALLFLVSIIMLFVGFMIGDEHHHECSDVAEERSFDEHVQSALWVARRTLAE